MAYIKASEIPEFLFCERAWWLRKKNYFGKLNEEQAEIAAERFKAGTEYHGRYFGNVRSSSVKRTLARRLILLAALLLVGAFFALVFVLQAHARPRSNHSQPGKNVVLKQVAPQNTDGYAEMEVVVYVVFAALIFIVVAAAIRWSARRQERRWNIPRRTAVAVVDDGAIETLSCDELELVGRPDGIDRDGGFCIPEERKSAILPPGQRPREGHILQLIACCYLVDRNIGPVQKGRLVYGDNQDHEIPFDESAKQWLTRTLERMKNLQSASAVARSHQSPARCAKCVASKMCFQSLA